MDRLLRRTSSDSERSARGREGNFGKEITLDSSTLLIRPPIYISPVLFCDGLCRSIAFFTRLYNCRIVFRLRLSSLCHAFPY